MGKEILQKLLLGRPGKSCKRCKRRLGTFCQKSRYFEGKLRLERGKLRMVNVEWRNDNSEMRLEGCGQSRYENFTNTTISNTNIFGYPLSHITL